MNELYFIPILIISNITFWIYIIKWHIPKLTQKIKNSLYEKITKFIKETMIDPTVKRGYSLAGKLGAEARIQTVLENKFSTAIIDKQIGAYKPLIKQFLKIDLDEAIKDYGAPTILQSIQKFMPTIQGFMGKKNKEQKTGGIP